MKIQHSELKERKGLIRARTLVPDHIWSKLARRTLIKTTLVTRYPAIVNSMSIRNLGCQFLALGIDNTVREISAIVNQILEP